MDETVMTGNELTTWRMIGADLGLEFDELGHPYQTGPARDIDGGVYDGCYDWRPLENDSDCLGLVLHHKLCVQCEVEGVIVRELRGPILAMAFYETEANPAAALRRAVFEAAAKLVRAKLQLLDKETACVKAQ